MGAIILQQRITMTFDSQEAWALRNALGGMSVMAWRTVGLNDDDIKAVSDIYRALDSQLNPPEVRNGVRNDP